MTHYFVLGVSPDADTDDIHAARRRITAQLRAEQRTLTIPPERFDEEHALVEEAYRVLADPELRTRYETSIADVELCPSCWHEISDETSPCPRCGTVASVSPPEPPPPSHAPSPDPREPEPADGSVVRAHPGMAGILGALVLLLAVAFFTPSLQDLGLVNPDGSAAQLVAPADVEAYSSTVSDALGRMLPWAVGALVALAYLGRRVVRHGSRAERQFVATVIGAVALFGVFRGLAGSGGTEALGALFAVSLVATGVGLAVELGIAWLLGALVDGIMGRPPYARSA